MLWRRNRSLYLFVTIETRRSISRTESKFAKLILQDTSESLCFDKRDADSPGRDNFAIFFSTKVKICFYIKKKKKKKGGGKPDYQSRCNSNRNERLIFSTKRMHRFAGTAWRMQPCLYDTKAASRAASTHYVRVRTCVSTVPVKRSQRGT